MQFRAYKLVLLLVLSSVQCIGASPVDGDLTVIFYIALAFIKDQVQQCFKPRRRHYNNHNNASLRPKKNTKPKRSLGHR
jgi:hypothetical protein